LKSSSFDPPVANSSPEVLYKRVIGISTPSELTNICPFKDASDIDGREWLKDHPSHKSYFKDFC